MNTTEGAGRNRASKVVLLITADGVKAAADGLSEESRSGQFVQIVRDGKVVGASNRLVAVGPLSTDHPAVGHFTAEQPGGLARCPRPDEVAALATTMNGMPDRVQASQRAQRPFVSDASHELRRPLSSLTTAAELAVEAHAQRAASRAPGPVGRRAQVGFSSVRDHGASAR